MAETLATYYGNNAGPSAKFRVVVQYRVTNTDPVKGYYLQRRYYIQVTTGQSSNFTSSLKVSWSSTKYSLSTKGNYAIQGWQNVGWVKYGSTVSYSANASYTGGSGTTYKSSVSGTYRVPYALTVNFYSNYATEAYADSLNEVGAEKNVIVRSAVYIETTPYPSGLYNYTPASATTYLARAGYEPTGYWGTLENGGILVYQDTPFDSAILLAKAFGKDLTKGNVTLNLYPQWKRIGYTITYNANGGAGAPDTQQKLIGEDIVLTTDVPVMDGYQCIGWSKSASAMSVDYLPGSVYTVDADLTLYAVWRKDGVLFKSENGTIQQGRPAMNGKSGVPWIRINGTWKRGGA